MGPARPGRAAVLRCLLGMGAARRLPALQRGCGMTGGRWNVWGFNAQDQRRMARARFHIMTPPPKSGDFMARTGGHRRADLQTQVLAVMGAHGRVMG